MTTALKRLWLALVTLALGAMSSGAMADTSYNFSYSGFGSGNSDPNDTFQIEGVFIVHDNVITNIINGKVRGKNPYTSDPITGSTITGLVNFGGNDNKYSSLDPYLSSNGVAFSTAQGLLNLYYDSGHKLCGNFGVEASANCYPVSTGTMTSSAAAVPEIDGALIPQVGLLLAGLFIILGRRKESTEPMLAV